MFVTEPSLFCFLWPTWSGIHIFRTVVPITTKQELLSVKNSMVTHAHMHMCLHVWEYMCVLTRISTAHPLSHPHMYIHMHIYPCTHKYTHASVYTCTATGVSLHMHANPRVYIRKTHTSTQHAVDCVLYIKSTE